jgi:hypothetical protein
MRITVTTAPVRFQMPAGRVDLTPKVRINFGPGLRPRSADWPNPNDRCFNIAVTRDQGQHWRRIWLGRGLWRVDPPVETGGTY